MGKKPIQFSWLRNRFIQISPLPCGIVDIVTGKAPPSKPRIENTKVVIE